MKKDEKDSLAEEREKRGLNPIIFVAIGIVIGLAIMIGLNIYGITFKNNTVAKINGKKITQDSVYEYLKENCADYALYNITDTVDKEITNRLYPELTSEQQQEIEKQLEDYLNSLEEDNIPEETFYEYYGFKDKEEFKQALTLDYKIKLYTDEYAKTLVSDEDVSKYYENDVYGDINSKHILVKISDEMTDENALALAKEIIKKLDKGATFDEVKEKYAKKITYQELGYQGFNSGFEESYMEGLKALENGKYSEEPVQTSYGYHIIYRIDQKEKSAFDDIKNEIKDFLIEQAKLEETFSYKALIKMREDNGFIITDEKIKEQYQEYCNSFLETPEGNEDILITE